MDRLIATPLEALADSLEKRLKGNLDSHVEAVQKRRQKKGKVQKVTAPSAKTTAALGEWAMGAADIDPDERELTAVWRSILDEILDGKDKSDELLRVVRTLPSSDVRFFIRLYAQRRIRLVFFRSIVRRWLQRRFDFAWEETMLTRLKTQGLLGRPINLSSLFSIAAIAVALGYVFILPNIERIGPNASPSLNFSQSPPERSRCGSGILQS